MTKLVYIALAVMLIEGIFFSTRRTQHSFSINLLSTERTVELPTLTGPYAIGRSSFNWTDTTRPEAMTEDPTDHRELIVHLWYPTQPTTNSEKAPYMPNLAALKKAIKGPEVNAWQSVQTHTVVDAPVSDSKPNYPVLVFSPGNMMNSASYSFLIEDLASHGYVVAAIDHPYDARAVLLSNGKVAIFGEERWPRLKPSASALPPMDSDYARFYRERVKVRATDASFVLNQLESLNAGKTTARFSGRFDLTHVAILGHSVGGVAVGEACHLDQRFKAGVNLDGMTGEGPFYLDANGQSFNQPLLLLTKPFFPSDDKLAEWKITRQDWQTMREKNDNRFFKSIKSGSYRIAINGATHQSFSDDPLLISMLTKPQEIEAHRRRAKIIRDYTLAFLDKHLRGNSVVLLDKSSSEYPEVTFDSWKNGASK